MNLKTISLALIPLLSLVSLLLCHRGLELKEGLTALFSAPVRHSVRFREAPFQRAVSEAV